jgi:prolyl oligopeptidase
MMRMLPSVRPFVELGSGSVVRNLDVFFRRVLCCMSFVVITGASMAGHSKDLAPGFGELKSEAWLEVPDGDRATAWVNTQNHRVDRQLAQDPVYREYFDQTSAINQNPGRVLAATSFLQHEWVYALWQDEAHPRGLWRRVQIEAWRGPNPNWETLLDVDALAKSEGKDWLVYGIARFSAERPSRCMLMLSNGGGHVEEWREFDLDKKAFVPGGFIVPESKQTTLVWRGENALLVSTDVGPDSVSSSTGAPVTARLWLRGQPITAAREVFRAPEGYDWVLVSMAADNTGNALFFASATDSSGAEYYWKLEDSGTSLRMTLPPKSRLHAAVHHGEIVVSLQSDWDVDGKRWKAGSLISMPVSDSTKVSPHVRLMMKPSDFRQTISEIQVTRYGVLAYGTWNVRGRLWALTFDGSRWRHRRVNLPDYGVVQPAFFGTVNPDGYASTENFLDPPTVYKINAENGGIEIQRSDEAQFDSHGMTVEQLDAVSSDGARVPYFLVRSKKIKFDGETPTLLQGYGAYGGSQRPYYSGVLGRLWLSRGGAFVLANIRGGSEYGASWHVTKTQRRLTYDDFTAVAEDLIHRGITSPKKLGIWGYSAGGLLAGVTLTQRPDLINAAVLLAPPLDLLRMDLMIGGVAQQAPEFGSPDIPEERAFLEKTSPYQNLHKVEGFPEPLIISSSTDDNVYPGQPRRFAAKIEALGMPFLYFETHEGGHGLAFTPEQRARLEALEYTYLAMRLMSDGKNAATQNDLLGPTDTGKSR